MCQCEYPGPCACPTCTGRHESTLYRQWAAKRDQWEAEHPGASGAEKLAALARITENIGRQVAA